MASPFMLLALALAASLAHGPSPRGTVVHVERDPAPAIDELAARVGAELAAAGFTVVEVSCPKSGETPCARAGAEAIPDVGVVTLRVDGPRARVGIRAAREPHSFTADVDLGDSPPAARAAERAALQVAEWLAAVTTAEPPSPPSSPPAAPAPAANANANVEGRPAVRRQEPVPTPAPAGIRHRPQLRARWSWVPVAVDVGLTSLFTRTFGTRTGPEIGAVFRPFDGDGPWSAGFARLALSFPRLGRAVAAGSTQVGVDYDSATLSLGIQRTIGSLRKLTLEGTAFAGATRVTYSVDPPFTLFLGPNPAVGSTFGGTGHAWTFITGQAVAAVYLLSGAWSVVVEGRVLWMLPRLGIETSTGPVGPSGFWPWLSLGAGVRITL